MEDVLISWSGGKDSCLALYGLQQAGTHRAAALLTTVTRDFDRVQMHGVRRVLLERQAASLGLPLRQVLIPKGASNEEYERATAEAFAEYRGRELDAVVFGDLFLEDVRAYRDQFLARQGMRGLYPVWGRDTAEFAREFIALGAIVAPPDAAAATTVLKQLQVRASQCFKSFHTAECALEGIEAINMMRRGQVKRLAGSDAQGQAKFVASLFGIAA
jgi:diphthamide synthase (EF-2-diphthine--ammonia ligase)